MTENPLDLTNILSCPICRESSHFEVREGSVSCTTCETTYKVHKGIPIMVDLKTIPKHLRQQIKYFKKESVTSTTTYKLDEWQKRYIERFLDVFPNVSNKVIVDNAAGSGYMTIELAKLGAQVIATDLTLQSLIRLKSIAESLKLSENVLCVCCNSEQLSLKTNLADYFISNAILEHLPRELEAIEEIGRICKTDAGLMVTVPQKYRLLSPLLIPVNYIYDKRIGHLRRYDKETLAKRFEGWTMLRSYYTGHTKKVLKALINFFIPIFDERMIEEEDLNSEHKAKGAINIISFFTKK